ncbi:MAG: hypothetical protein L3J00_02415 [Thiomicrorhabdus sp.]|nr:hypothetical protein [Thiomicrorhabdus sp.]
MSSLVDNKIFLVPFFTELNAQQIQYCVLRNYDTLPTSLGGSDLDILVKSKDINRFYKALYRVLQRTEGEIIIRYGQLSPRICVTGFNAACWYALQIDVHESILPYKSSSMFPVDFLLSRVHTHNGIKVANDEDSNLIAFLKEALNNKKIQLKYFEPAKIAWGKNKYLYRQELSKIYSVDFLDDLSEALQSNYSPKIITKLAILGQKQLTKHFKTKVLNLKLKLFKAYRFFSPPGYTIAFLGADGTRKTTVINKVMEVLNEASHNELYYEHSRPNLIPSIATLWSNKKNRRSSSPLDTQKKSSFIVSMMLFLYYLVDYIVGYWIKVYPKKVKKSCIWVFDTYFYDYLTGSKRERIKLPVWIIKLAQFFIPEPDLVICLGENPEVICNRNLKMTLKETEAQVNNNLKLFCDSKPNVFWIDIDQSEEVPINECLRVISKHMSSRYK